MSKRKYFIHGESGKDDDITCTHPLVSKLQLVKNLEVTHSNGVPLPQYQIVIYFSNKKDITFGGEFISSALEFADQYLKTVFPFDTFVIVQDGKTLELSNDYDKQVVVTAKAGDKSVSQIINSRQFIKLISTVLNNIPASEPCGEVKPLLEIFMDKLSNK